MAHEKSRTCRTGRTSATDTEYRPRNGRGFSSARHPSMHRPDRAESVCAVSASVPVKLKTARSLRDRHLHFSRSFHGRCTGAAMVGLYRGTQTDRKRVGWGKIGSVRVYQCGRSISKKKKK